MTELSAAAEASRLAIHGNIVFAGTVFAADFVSASACQSFKGVRSLGGITQS
jgi:hypothetical protein